MDFTYQYTEEQEQFRREVRSWLQENIPDDKRAPVDRNELSDEMYAWWRDMHQTLAEKGWLYPTYPKEYGGGGLSGEHETILQEEFRIASVVNGFINSLVFPTLLVWADDSQKELFLKPLLSAEKVAFQNFSEPNAGSDLASLQARAVRDGDDWLITGQKIWISGQRKPDILFGPMVTDPDAPRHRNLGYFMVPFPSEGLDQERMNLLSGDDQSVFFFDNVRVPGDHLIGGEQQGCGRSRARAEDQQERDERNLKQQRHVDQNTECRRDDDPQHTFAEIGRNSLTLQHLDGRSAREAGHDHEWQHAPHQSRERAPPFRAARPQHLRPRRKLHLRYRGLACDLGAGAVVGARATSTGRPGDQGPQRERGDQPKSEPARTEEGAEDHGDHQE